MRRSFVLSPLSPPVATHNPRAYRRQLEYAQQALQHSVIRGEDCIHGTLAMVQILTGDNKDDRTVETQLEVQANWLDRSDVVVVYIDQGVSPAIRAIIDLALSCSIPVEYRALAGVEIANSDGARAA